MSGRLAAVARSASMMISKSAAEKRQRRARGVCLSCRQPAVKGRSRCEWHLEAERARQRRRVDGTRVPLLEAVAGVAREMERRATGKALQPTPEQWQRLTAALAALDAMGDANV